MVGSSNDCCRAVLVEEKEIVATREDRLNL